MPSASRLRSLANHEPDQARLIILRAFYRAKYDHDRAALDLRGARLLPPEGTEARSRVTLYSIIRTLRLGAEIYALRNGLACPIPEAVEPATASPVVVVTPPAPMVRSDAERLIRARGTMTRAECARAAGLKDESSVRNVESPTRGMALAGRLRAWVEQQEAAL
jgi:hypothetical protein